MSINPEITTDWNVVVRRDGPKLFRYFCARFDHQQAADLVQEVLLRLVRKERTQGFQLASDNFTAYALGVAHFVAREAFKKHKRLKENLISDYGVFEGIAEVISGASADDDLMKARQAEMLRRAIGNLTLPAQEILSLLVEQDLNLQDIASILSIPLNTIKSHIHRSKEKLKIELSQLQHAADQRGESYERLR